MNERFDGPDDVAAVGIDVVVRLSVLTGDGELDLRQGCVSIRGGKLRSGNVRQTLG